MVFSVYTLRECMYVCDPNCQQCLNHEIVNHVNF